MHQPLATVFGGSGFIGRYVVRALAAQGWRVRVAVRRPHVAYFLRSLGAVGQVEPIQANIRDDASVARAVQGADAVINLVGILYESGSQSFAAIQAGAPGRIARAARAAGAQHFIQMSAIGAQSDSPSVYARTKAEGEAEVLAAFPNATILRPSIVFGPEDGFFNLFASLARLSPFLPLIGGGTAKMQPVYVVDVANAVISALTNAEAQARTYELGGPRVYSFKELMELTISITGARVWLLPVPMSIAYLKAFFLGLLPKPLLTVDQVRLLGLDNVVAPGQPGLSDLGITPTPAEAILPSYLRRYRRTGEYTPQKV
jgi:NADH dehydrogenase